MFSTLGLFSSVRCPELSSSNLSGTCKRDPCLFSHTVPAPSRLGGRVASTSASTSTPKRPLLEAQGTAQSPASASHPHLSNGKSKRVKLEQTGALPGTSASEVGRSAFGLFSRDSLADNASGSALGDVKPRQATRNNELSVRAQNPKNALPSTSALPAAARPPVASTTRTVPLKGANSLRKPGFQIGRNGQVVRTGTKPSVAGSTASAAASTSAMKGKGRAIDQQSPAASNNIRPSSTSSSTSSSGVTGPPRLPIDTKHTYFPIATRNAMIKAMHQEFMTLYEGLTPRGKAIPMASAHALAQELTIYGKNNKFSYRTACIQAIARLKKRSPAATFGEAGTLEDYEKWLKNVADEERSKLTVEKARRLTLDRESAEAYSYILDVPKGNGGAIPTEEGGTKICERCGTEFVVHGNLSEVEMQACTHHWGRQEITTADRVRRWACCQTPTGSPGCSTGPHVFSEKDATELHSRVGFMATSALPRMSSFEPPLQIAALDCELVYTTAGMALARLTIVTSEGLVVFDECIRPNGMVVDLVTRWSGITEDDVERRAKLDINQLRGRVLGRYLGSDTIVIGHGLENDLKALRLVHPAENCIDTAQLFPHPRGLPYRHALCNLSRDILQAFIQDGGAAGHSSAVDACTALDLVKHKAQKVEEGTARPNR